MDGPVFDTLTAVNHPDLRAGRLDLVAQQYQKGLAAYPPVDRFFAWSTPTDPSEPGEVLFYGRDRRYQVFLRLFWTDARLDALLTRRAAPCALADTRDIVRP